MFVDHQEPTASESASPEAFDPSTDPTLNLRRAEVSIIPLHKFQDQVSRTPWNAVGFSGDAEYVMGGKQLSDAVGIGWTKRDAIQVPRRKYRTTSTFGIEQLAPWSRCWRDRKILLMTAT